MRTDPLERDAIRVQNLEHVDKQHAEEDAKNVHVNLSPTVSSDFGGSSEIVYNQNSEAIESVKSETKSLLSRVIETPLSFFRSLFPEKKAAEIAPLKDSTGEEIQPTIIQRPILERPGYHAQASAHKFLQSNKENVEYVENIENLSLIEGTSGEGKMMKEIFGRMGKQVKLRQKSTEANQALIEARGKKQNRLIEEYMGFKDRAESRKETAEIFDWTGFGAGLLAGVLTLGAIAAAVATGGAAVALFLGAGAAVSAIASGGSEITSGVLKHQSSLDSGEAFRIKQEKELIANGTMTLLQDMESNDNSIAAVWSKIAQLLRNRPNFFR